MAALKTFDVPAKWANDDGTLTERARGFLRDLFAYVGANTGTLPVTSIGGDGTSTTTFLREDGQWANPTALSGGNPTAQVGLTAVNGTASTFVRSDGAPALNVGITPTWTGTHTFNVPIACASGGTGVNNGSSTITIGGNFAMSGAFAFTGTLTGATTVTFPTSGTLATTAQLPAGANPSGTVGLTAVNGAAATFMRSDGAPALSQAIAPTWTGQHTFAPASGATRFTAGGISVEAGKIYPPTDAGAAQTAAGLYAGTGAPNNANGADGDYYFRSDGGVGTHIYFKSGGAWAGLV